MLAAKVLARRKRASVLVRVHEGIPVVGRGNERFLDRAGAYPAQ